MKKSAFNGHVVLAQAEAAKLSLETAEKAACVPLIVENDCQEIVELATGRKCCQTEICWTIADIKEMLTRLSQATIQQTSRLCNGTAHSVAKMALNIVEHVMWAGNYPTDLTFFFFFNSLIS